MRLPEVWTPVGGEGKSRAEEVCEVQDSGMEPERQAHERRANFLWSGYVYFLFTSLDITKIGMTLNPGLRIEQIAREYRREPKIPFEITGYLICETWQGDEVKVERWFHEQWGGQRVNGEWFWLPHRDVTSLVIGGRLEVVPWPCIVAAYVTQNKTILNCSCYECMGKQVNH